MSADKKTKFKSIAIKLCAVGLTIVVGGLAYLCLMPKTYRAVAKVEILKSAWNGAGDAKSSFGSEKLPGECQTVRSDGILDRTITNLNLNALWGRRLSQGAPLKTEQTRERLREMLDIHPALNSSVIEVAATGGDPVELAKIVNEIARLYCAFRQTGREGASRRGINSLRAMWEAQNQKVQQAQTALDKLAYEYNMDRATNAVEVYDAKALESLQTKRAALEDDYRNKSDQLAKLKSLDQDELTKLLSTNDAQTNSVLTNALQQLAKAKNDLRDAQTAHGPDAPETKSAELVVAQLNRRVNGLVNSAISLRELDLVAVKTTLDRINGMAETANHSTNDLRRIAAQDATYAKAKADLNKLIHDRDALEREISGNGSMTAVMPDVITARIVELADPPVKPESPDGRIALGALITGGVVTGAGLFLLVLLNMKPRGAEKKAG